MINNELLLDERIMYWVFIPIIGVTFLISMIRFYYNLYSSYHRVKKIVKNKISLQEYMDQQINSKCQRLTHKCHLLSEDAFNTRRSFLCESGKGFLEKKGQRQPVDLSNAMLSAQGSMMQGMKNSMVMMGTMIPAMAWINSFFSGFVVARVPLSLTQKFRSMTQSGINLQLLDVRYISSVSFYFMILFGLGQIQSLLFGNDRDPMEEDNPMVVMMEQLEMQSQAKTQGAGMNSMMGPMGGGMMGQGMMGQGMMGGPPKKTQPKEVFKTQVEALQLVNHNFFLEKCPQLALQKLNSIQYL